MKVHRYERLEAQDDRQALKRQVAEPLFARQQYEDVPPRAECTPDELVLGLVCGCLQRVPAKGAPAKGAPKNCGGSTMRRQFLMITLTVSLGVSIYACADPDAAQPTDGTGVQDGDIGDSVQSTTDGSVKEDTGGESRDAAQSTDGRAKKADSNEPADVGAQVDSDSGVVQKDSVDPEDTGVGPEDTGVDPEDTGVDEDTGAEPEDTGVDPDDTGVEPEDTGAKTDISGIDPAEYPIPDTNTCHIEFYTTLDGQESVKVASDEAPIPLVAHAKNLTDVPLLLQLKDYCPAGPALFSGLPTVYDYYHTCNAGMCAEPIGPLQFVLPPSTDVPIAAATLSVGGNTCNDALPVPPGQNTSYAITFTVKLVGDNPNVCYPADNDGDGAPDDSQLTVCPGTACSD